MALLAEQDQLAELAEIESKELENQRIERGDMNFQPAGGAGLLPEEEWNKIPKEITPDKPLPQE
jgi:hypothetical protein